MKLGLLNIGIFPKIKKIMVERLFNKNKTTMNTILIYDESFSGFLSAVYHVFDKGLKNVSIVKPKHYVPDMFAEGKRIEANEEHARRVWSSLEVKITKHGAKEMYKAFLSEIKGTEDVLLQYIMHVYATESFNYTDLSNVSALRVSQVARMVTREMHHIQTYLEFKTTDDDMDVAVLNSNFNMIPLIGNYFKRRYLNKKWLIYDARRKYALHFDMEALSQTRLSVEKQSEILQRSEFKSPLLYVNLQDSVQKEYGNAS